MPPGLEQGGHLHIMSSGGIPLVAFLLLRGYRREAPATILAGWLTVAWQVSIGFSLGLPLLVVLAGAGAALSIAWWRAGRPALPRAVVRAKRRQCRDRPGGERRDCAATFECARSGAQAQPYRGHLQRRARHVPELIGTEPDLGSGFGGPP